MSDFLASPIPVLLGLGLVAFYLLRRLNDRMHRSGEWFPTDDGRMGRYDPAQKRWHYRERISADESKIKSDRAW